MKLQLDKWIPLPEAARMVGEPLWKFRARMMLLDEHYDRRLLRPRGRGKRRRHYMVSAEALMHLLRTDPNAYDAERQQMLTAIDELTRKVQSLRDQQVAFRKKAFDWLTRHDKQLAVATPSKTQESASRR